MNGWYGETCQLRCGDCVRCSQSSGICTECSDEKYGSSCEYNCSINCLPTVDGVKSCDINTAACASLACVDGYYGPDCVTACHTNCNARPDDGVVVCDFVSGACLFDCKSLFYGVKCELACESYCHDQTCGRNSGMCPDCFLPVPPPNCPDAGMYTKCHNPIIL